MTEHGRPGEIQIADTIERLVTHEFVVEAQAAVVHDTVVGQHDSVVERPAESQAVLAQLIDIAEETEGAGARELALEDAVPELDVTGLIGDHRMLEADLERYQKSIGRRQGNRAVALGHRDGLENFNGGTRGLLLDNAHAFGKEDERRRATVHGRHFAAVELDQQVIDAEAGEGRQEVFDGPAPDGADDA